MEIINAKEMETNPTLSKFVEPNNDLKNFLVEYVGDKKSPEDQNITVEMIVEVLAEEFPEFLLPIAEENFIRGYEQALTDAETAWRQANAADAAMEAAGAVSTEE